MIAPVRRGRELAAAARKLRELEAHDRWSAERFASYQRASLNRMVAAAVERSPFYRDRYRAAGVGPASLLTDLPPLTKVDVMDNFDSLVCDPRLKLRELETHLASVKGDDIWLGEYRVLMTGGTTGVKGVFVYDRREWAQVVAGTLRWPRMAGMSFLKRGRRWRVAVVGGSGPQAMSARAARSNNIGNSVRLTLAATEPLARLAEQLDAFQPDVISAYASMLALLAGEQLDGRIDIAPRVVISHSEQLTLAMRQRIITAWGTEPYDTYSTTEIGTIGAECPEHRGIHLLEDSCIVEVVDEHNRPVAPGTPGQKLLATSLFRRAQPLIRYEITDMLEIDPEPCACGRPYRLLRAISGRADDVLHLPGPTGDIAVHPNQFIRAIEPHPDVRQFQIVRNSDHIAVHVVARPGADGDLAQVLTVALRNSLAELGVDGGAIRTAVVDHIPRSATAAAKHKLVADLRTHTAAPPSCK